MLRQRIGNWLRMAALGAAVTLAFGTVAWANHGATTMTMITIVAMTKPASTVTGTAIATASAPVSTMLIVAAA